MTQTAVIHYDQERLARGEVVLEPDYIEIDGVRYVPVTYLATRCARELAGYAVPVEPGQELAVIEARLAELDRCCASYSRSSSRLHVLVSS